MKTYLEMAEAVFCRRDTYIAAKKKRDTVLRTVALTIAVVTLLSLTLTAAFSLGRKPQEDKPPLLPTESNGPAETYPPTENTDAVSDSTALTTTQDAHTEIPPEESSTFSVTSVPAETQRPGTEAAQTTSPAETQKPNTEAPPEITTPIETTPIAPPSIETTPIETAPPPATQGPGTETDDEPIPDIKFSYMHASWPAYGSIDKLMDTANCIYEGIVTDIFFDIINMRTGEPTRQPDPESPSAVQLYTIYEITVTHSYKNADTEKLYIKVIGGIEGYKVIEQYRLMKAAGIWSDLGTIVICDGCEPLNIGDSYLFFTKNSRGGPYNNIVNPDQFAFSENRPSRLCWFDYNDIIDYFEEIGISKTDKQQPSNAE